MTEPFAESFVFEIPRWPCLGWTLADVVDVIGSDTEIQYQTNRLDDPNYEINSHAHRAIGRFGLFATCLTVGEPNDVYLTAQNMDHPPTRQALQPLLSMCRPLPGWLDDHSNSFVWLGRGTVTPLHHDLTDNTMCQVIGEKHVRLFSPDQREHLDPTTGVHSSLGWVSDEVVAERSLDVRDVHLRPGLGVFIPQGWWHCVRTHDVSLTVVFT